MERIEAWHSERGQEMPLVKGQPQWQLKTQDWKVVKGQAESLRLGTMKRIYQRLVVTVQASCSRRASVLEKPEPRDDFQEQQQQWRGDRRSLEDKLCVLQREESEK